MGVSQIRAAFRQWSESRVLSSDLSRATRTTVGFMLPLIFLPRLHWPLSATFVALGAQSLSTIDIRGAYSLRVGVLLTVTLVYACYAAMGATLSGQVLLAVLVTGVFTLAAGVWRHLSSEYGASILISSLLMLFLGLAGPPGLHTAKVDALSLAAGCGLAIAIHILFWPLRPQHPLRQTVAESWVAAANLLASLAPVPPTERAIRHEKIIDAENELHATIDKTGLLLIQASGQKSSILLAQLEALNLCAARLALAVDDFNSALEGCISADDWLHLAPAIDPVLTTLTNTARTIALTVVSRNPAHLTTARIRLRRAAGLLRVFKARLQSEAQLDSYHRQLEKISGEIENQLPVVIDTLEKTVERSDERSAFTTELFDLNAWMLKPVAATLNLGQKPDRALIRYIIRLAVLTMIGVAVFQYFHLRHGYWLPFTMVVILQPDFGATRQRAAQRVAGTLVGSVVATAFLWLHPPPNLVLIVIAIATFGYAYILRRHYGTAIFFVTIFVVLLLESGATGQAHVALERVLTTCTGGVLAFGAAAWFWPTWERDRFPVVLAAAFRANAEYLSRLIERLSRSEAETNGAVVAAKRNVERAHAGVFASLRRMFGDPQNRREGVEQSAALANGNQRLTRILNLIFVQVQRGPSENYSRIEAFGKEAVALLTTLADEVTAKKIQPIDLNESAKRVEAATPKADVSDLANPDRRWLFFQCGRAATELSALALIAQGDLTLRQRDPRLTETPSPANPAIPVV